MAHIILTKIAALAMLGCALAPAAALAEDSTCRNGLYTRQDSFAQARVTADRAFFYQDADGCPVRSVRGGVCRSRSYVIEGDELVIARRMGDFVCAFYPNESGGTAGWVKVDALHIGPLDTNPPLSGWLGSWTDGAAADVTITSSGDGAHIAGTAFWPARPEENDWISIHVGEVDDRLAISGHRARYADDNLCELDLTLLRDFLLIADNHKCGGLNVSFSGVYTRSR